MYKRISIIIVTVCILMGSIGNFSYAAENMNPKFKSLESIERYIVSQLSERNPIIEFDIINSNLISQIIAVEKAGPLLDAFNRAITKKPYSQYTYSTLKYGFDGFSDRITVKYTIGYMTTLEQERELTEAVKRVLKEITTDSMSDVEKIKAINDFIVLNTEYNLSYAENPYSPYTVMFKGQGVCQGYALLAHLMFEELGIDNMLILGSALNESHLWNLVKIADEWFHLDITWNDPLPDVKGRVIYKYFLKDDSFMKNTHIWNTTEYPKAKSPSYTHLTEFKSNKITQTKKLKYAPDDTYSNWAKAEIDKAITYELVTQKILNNFTADITREEFAELSLQLYRLLGGKTETKANSNIFKDTQNLSIIQAYSVGIVNGIGDGKFDPEGKITRQQMACMLERVLTALEISPIVTMEYRFFNDESEIADYAKNSVQLMNKLGVISGVGQNRINPRGNTSREQAIAMIVRLFEQFSK